MKKFLVALFASLACHLLYAQQSVGIGTNSPDPSAQLDVTSISKGFLMPRMTSAQRTAIGSPAPGLMVYETTTGSVWLFNGAWTQFGSGGSSQWTTSGNNIYNSNTGNVGIGTSTPTSKLHVVGNGLIDGVNPIIQFQQSGVSKGFVQLSTDNIRIGTNSGNGAGKLVIRMNGTDRIFIDSIGQMGIGRSIPTYDLDIDGVARIQNTSLSGKSVISLFANPNNAFDPYAPAGILFANYQDAGGGNYNYSTKYKIEMMGGPTERMKLYHVDYDNQLVIHKNGNIGINEIFPTEKLQVNGNTMLETGKPFLIIKTTSPLFAAQSGIRFSNSTANGGNIIYTNNSLYLSGSDTTATGNPRPDIVINTGNVGLGTANPSEKLHLIGNALINYINPTIQLQNSAVDKGFIQLNGNDIRIGTYASNAAGKFIIRTNNTDQVFVDNNGNMGFNVSPPLARLHILTGNDVSISSHGYLMLGSVTGSNLIFDNNEIMARNNGSTSSLILQNDGGTVRIGNVAVPANYKFAINGKMICEEVRVKLSTSWPDYVFSDAYRLRPLKEVEQFINANKHLPNMAPASMIEKEGLDVGDMNRKLLEKVEELTLYIIQQQKEIDLLKIQMKQKTAGE